MRMVRVALYAMALVGAMVTAGWAQPANMTREERIKAHRQNIQEIIQANRVILANVRATSESEHMPRVTMPSSFDQSVVPLLKEVKASDAQIEELRKINNGLWELRVHDKDATAPQVAAKVKSLLEQQDKVLTPEQRKQFVEAYREHMEALRARSGGRPAAPAKQQ